MANLITIPILKCIRVWFFTITQEVVVATTLFTFDLTSSLFDDAKKGKITLTMHVLISPFLFTHAQVIVFMFS